MKCLNCGNTIKFTPSNNCNGCHIGWVIDIGSEQGAIQHTQHTQKDKKIVENLVGESMEDMGLEGHFE